MPLSFRHVDVFAATAFTGNSLAVVPDSGGLSTSQMLAITQELRHFETIFLSRAEDAEEKGAPETVRARVFDLFEELDFAGHPVLGAAAVLHEQEDAPGARHWTFQLPGKTVTVTTRRTERGYHATLDQGRPEFGATLSTADAHEVAGALSLPAEALAELPLEVVSTGLRYLIVPVRGHLAAARIVHDDFAELLARHGAQFVYVVDVDAREGRHWNNDGILEDVATGSAAGCVGAYLAGHRVVPVGKEFVLHQGRFVGRPSRITVLPEGLPRDLTNIRVGGDVVMVARATLDTVPQPAGQ
ncbi:PhzF family phenazine biosynthesis protein [Streptomyces sp. NPDC096132]|uniref:PhzF family phenazine biosynthesis protein n=1 Tax=Streptomyces sp. NPDC096132 TaxID=3366075 RepID=UPI003815D2C9